MNIIRKLQTLGQTTQDRHTRHYTPENIKLILNLNGGNYKSLTTGLLVYPSLLFVTFEKMKKAQRKI